MYDKQEFPPLLPDGLHTVSLEQLEALCVTQARFSLSATRKEIMAGLREVATRITRTGISCSVWVDGSFLTEKIDPWDVDLVAFIPARFYDDGAPEQLAVVDWLTSRDNEPRKLYRCDTHAEPMYPELAPFHYMVAGALDYWRNTYGRSVGGGAPKGIAVLELVGDAQ